MNNIKFKAIYETNSFVYVDEKIKLNIVFEENEYPLDWKCSDESKALVVNGIVYAKEEGNIYIDALLEEKTLFRFYVTILKKDKRPIVNALLNAHNSNIFVRKDLNICGKDGYNKDIIGSVSKLLFNEQLVINDEYLSLGNKKWDNNPDKEYMKSIEFITVHYTANIRSGADAQAHANYFVNEDQPTSIHYCTGNDGIYLCLDNNKRAAHAGDSAGPLFSWLDTGVAYDGCPLDEVDVSVSDDHYYVINNKKTNIPLPNPYQYKDRKTVHKYLKNGNLLLENTNKEAKIVDFFNKQKFAFIEKNNKYYMSQTWWCYTQTLEGAICNVGGNRNSIGIESCVNYGSDLWYTWQKTAKLVAKLMIDNKLDISRVKGHHFFTAKNCPQPMLENDMEIWKKFIELIETEYLFMTNYQNYDINVKSLSDNLLDNGRITAITNKCVNYEIKIINKDTKQEEVLILSSII